LTISCFGLVLYVTNRYWRTVRDQNTTNLLVRFLSAGLTYAVTYDIERHQHQSKKHLLNGWFPITTCNYT